MWNHVQWNLTHRWLNDIFVVYLYVWFRHMYTYALSLPGHLLGPEARDAEVPGSSHSQLVHELLYFWTRAFGTASSCRRANSWCCLAIDVFCWAFKTYQREGLRHTRPKVQLNPFANIHIYFDQALREQLSLTFSKDLICVVWECFMVQVRWLSWLCGSWSFVRRRFLNIWWQSWRTVPLPRQIYCRYCNLLIACWWLMVTDSHLMEIKARSTMFLGKFPITSLSFCPCWAPGLGLCFPQRRRDQAPPRTQSTNNCYRL